MEAMEKIFRGDLERQEGPAVLERMFEKVEQLPDAYHEAEPNIERRGLNQGVFKGFWIAGREARRQEYQPVYEDLLNSDLSDPARSNRDYVAGEEGFEPSIS
jgi:hypothetical protein